MYTFGFALTYDLTNAAFLLETKSPCWVVRLAILWPQKASGGLCVLAIVVKLRSWSCGCRKCANGWLLFRSVSYLASAHAQFEILLPIRALVCAPHSSTDTRRPSFTPACQFSQQKLSEACLKLAAGSLMRNMVWRFADFCVLPSMFPVLPIHFRRLHAGWTVVQPSWKELCKTDPVYCVAASRCIAGNPATAGWSTWPQRCFHDVAFWFQGPVV